MAHLPAAAASDLRLAVHTLAVHTLAVHTLAVRTLAVASVPRREQRLPRLRPIHTVRLQVRRSRRPPASSINPSIHSAARWSRTRARSIPTPSLLRVGSVVGQAEGTAARKLVTALHKLVVLQVVATAVHKLAVQPAAVATALRIPVRAALVALRRAATVALRRAATVAHQRAATVALPRVAVTAGSLAVAMAVRPPVVATLVSRRAATAQRRAATALQWAVCPVAQHPWCTPAAVAVPSDKPATR
jgi:hypothetical protein